MGDQQSALACPARSTAVVSAPPHPDKKGQARSRAVTSSRKSLTSCVKRAGCSAAKT
jgi:hypothetical protein